MPSYGEVELAAGAVGGRRRERDGGYVNVREYMVMVMVMIVMMMTTGLVAVPVGRLLRHVKTQKLPQPASPGLASGGVVADGGGGGRQVREGRTAAQIAASVRQQGARHSRDGAEKTRRQARTDRGVRDAELAYRVDAGAGHDVLEGRRTRGRLLAPERGLAELGAGHR